MSSRSSKTLIRTSRNTAVGAKACSSVHFSFSLTNAVLSHIVRSAVLPAHSKDLSSPSASHVFLPPRFHHDPTQRSCQHDESSTNDERSPAPSDPPPSVRSLLAPVMQTHTHRRLRTNVNNISLSHLRLGFGIQCTCRFIQQQNIW